MNLTPALTDQHQIAVQEAIKTMCRIFWGPDMESCRALIQRKFLLPFENLEPVLNQGLSDALQEINSFIMPFMNEEALFQNLEETYVRLFVNTRAEIQTPLFQSCYEDERALLMGEAAVKMKKKLEAKGLTLTETIHEPPDHLSVELEYLYFLLDNGRINQDDTLLAEAGIFAADMMLPWIKEFVARLRQEKDNLFYPQIALILGLILNLIAGFKDPL
jgi:TorA-specific chaperone